MIVSLSKVRLIVVDDDLDVRAIVAGFLLDSGYSVLEAVDGIHALDVLTHDPSVRMMISDIRMPGMSGIELAEEAVRRRPLLRVILITGFGGHQQHKWPFLLKPFRRSMLYNLVHRFLETNPLCGILLTAPYVVGCRTGTSSRV